MGRPPSPSRAGASIDRVCRGLDERSLRSVRDESILENLVPKFPYIGVYPTPISRREDMIVPGDEARLDALDRKILEALQADASLSNAELAAAVGLSASPCWRRVQNTSPAKQSTPGDPKRRTRTTVQSGRLDDRPASWWRAQTRSMPATPSPGANTYALCLDAVRTGGTAKPALTTTVVE